jgi:hypothetical protein
MSDQKIKSAADLHAERLEQQRLYTEAYKQVGGKKLAMDQAVKIVASPGYTGDKKDVMDLARGIHTFMTEA